MKIITAIAVATIFFLPSTGNAQTGNGVDYFPLEVGNAWTFFELIDPPNAPPDTVRQFTSTIVGTELINDTLYYAFDRDLIMSNHWRTDGQGRYWGRVAGLDQLVLDFNTAETDTFSLFISGEPFQHYNVVTTESEVLSVAAGEFENVKTVGFNAPDGWLDASPSIAFALDIGPIVLVGSSGEWGQLLSASVNGEIITSVDAIDEMPLSRVIVPPFPNPFRSSTSFSLTLPVGAGHPRVIVYNAVGQQVERLEPIQCSRPRCDFRWEAADFPAGIYFFQSSIPTGEVISPVVLVR